MPTLGPDDPTPPAGVPTAFEDPITEPDLPRFACPYCPGEDGRPTGMVLDTSRWGSDQAPGTYKAIAKKCPTCDGSRIINRQQMAVYHAMRQGRPR